MRLPREKWGSFIRQKIGSVSKKDRKSKNVTFSPVVERITIHPDGKMAKETEKIKKEHEVDKSFAKSLVEMLQEIPLFLSSSSNSK